MEESSIGTLPRHATFDFMMTLEVIRLAIKYIWYLC